MQRFVGVDVSDAGNQRLVEERSLHMPRTTAQPFDRRTRRVEPIGTELAFPSIEHRLHAPVRDDSPEPPRIPEHQHLRTAPGQRPRDVAMRRRRLVRDEQLSRHPELHDERPAVIDHDAELLPASFE